jgi:hypothetical protein
MLMDFYAKRHDITREKFIGSEYPFMKMTLKEIAADRMYKDAANINSYDHFYSPEWAFAYKVRKGNKVSGCKMYFGNQYPSGAYFKLMDKVMAENHLPERRSDM